MFPTGTINQQCLGRLRSCGSSGPSSSALPFRPERRDKIDRGVTIATTTQSAAGSSTKLPEAPLRTEIPAKDDITTRDINSFQAGLTACEGGGNKSGNILMGLNGQQRRITVAEDARPTASLSRLLPLAGFRATFTRRFRRPGPKKWLTRNANVDHRLDPDEASSECQYTGEITRAHGSLGCKYDRQDVCKESTTGSFTDVHYMPMATKMSRLREARHKPSLITAGSTKGLPRVVPADTATSEKRGEINFDRKRQSGARKRIGPVDVHARKITRLQERGRRYCEQGRERAKSQHDIRHT